MNNNVLRTCLIVTVFLTGYAEAVNRTIGIEGKPDFVEAIAACDGTNPLNFQRGQCTRLIDCIYANTTSDSFKARLSSGTSIAALIPTMLALIGASPLELVQLGLISPHRAVATCWFCIGLPTGLFRQLRPLNRQLSDLNPRDLRVREWTVPQPTLSGKPRLNLAGKIAVDMLIVGLGAIMFWRNIRINNSTMVPWRCEWAYLLLAWPLACIFWLFLAIGLLWFFRESIEIYHASNPRRKYTIWQLMTIPYRYDQDLLLSQSNDSSDAAINERATSKATPENEPMVTLQEVPSVTPSNSQFSIRPGIKRSDTTMSYGGNYVVVRVTMRSVNGLRSWRWYEAIIEALAFGIYLYATSVLTSLVFLLAEEAMWYMFGMTMCLSAVRILTTVF